MLPVSNPSPEVLIAAALRYLGLGYSVLPLIGGDDPEIAKRSAVAWSEYQRRHATPAEVKSWFLEQGFLGLGILTGQLSCFAALDLDMMRLACRFEERHPKLAETLRVLTRRGFHLYFATRRRDRFPNRKLPGIEFRYEGQYVVAPPTVIAGHTYTAAGRDKPIPLTTANWLAIQRFLDEIRDEGRESACAAEGLSPRLREIKPTEGAKKASKKRVSQLDREIDLSWTPDLPLPQTPALSAEALWRLYGKLVKSEGGRNDALFKTCLAARDSGVSHAQAVASLLEMFVHSVPVSRHRPETFPRRAKEGKATIASAYSRRPRPLRKPQTTQLANSIREALFARGLTSAVRVIEGLRLKGIQPGQTFSGVQAKAMLAGLVGRDSIYAALNATVEGKRVFSNPAPPEPPSPQRPANAAAPIPTTDLNASVCLPKSGKNPRGRPSGQFIMPDNAELCAALGVSISPSDPIEEADLRSAKATRQAMHRELIKRRPDQYTIHWLAARLGVSPLTVRRYNRQIEHLHAAPSYFSTRITWDNLNAIPDEDSNGPGFLLEDDRGKRYPALVGIARKLLAKGRRVYLLKQEANYYWYGEPTEPPVIAAPQPRPIKTRADWQPLETPFGKMVRRFIHEIERARTQPAPPPKRFVLPPRSDAPPEKLRLMPCPIPPETPPESMPPPKPPPREKVDPRRFWHPLEDEQEEWMAQKIYDAVNQRTANENERISKATARRWVDEYGERLIRMALEMLEWRHNIQKPAGFVKTVLRSTAKFGHRV